MVVARGSDQTQLSTRFETRDDPAVLRNYGALLVQVGYQSLMALAMTL